MEINLTKGAVAIVDDADFEHLNKHRWYLHSAGYAARSKKNKGVRSVIYMHREITNAPAGSRVDHQNGNTLDNRRANLRLTDAIGNNCNRRKVSGKSAYKGVSWDKHNSKWRASIQFRQQTYRLGRFILEEDAARAYDKAALKYHGEFAVFNFPKESHCGQS
jgi:hypothetical protein